MLFNNFFDEKSIAPPPSIKPLLTLGQEFIKPFLHDPGPELFLVHPCPVCRLFCVAGAVPIGIPGPGKDLVDILIGIARPIQLILNLGQHQQDICVAQLDQVA